MLAIEGYARIHLRLTAGSKLYFIEANPNPILAEVRASGCEAGPPYPKLIDRIIGIGMKTVRR